MNSRITLRIFSMAPVLLLAFAVTLGVGARPAAASPCKGPDATCRTSQSCCDRNCVRELRGDKWGICCAPGQANCDGTCTDLTTATDCGACGNLCNGGTVCTGGVCQCPAGQTNCSGSCVDVLTDSANCGACGQACPAGEECASGVCECIPPTVDCAGECTDLTRDDSNCGACGNYCDGGLECQNGGCQCPAGTYDCGFQNCMTLCSDRPDYYQDRFQFCYASDQLRQGNCSECMTWIDCYGDLDTGVAACGTQTVGCPGT